MKKLVIAMLVCMSIAQISALAPINGRRAAEIKAKERGIAADLRKINELHAKVARERAEVARLQSQAHVEAAEARTAAA